jgi:hypothetical protein
VGSPIDFEDVVVKILHAQAEARDADFANVLELVIRGVRARPRMQLSASSHGSAFMESARWRSWFSDRYDGVPPPEIDEVWFAAADELSSGVDFQLCTSARRDKLRLQGSLVRINLEVTGVTAFPAERNVDVEAEGCQVRASGVRRAGGRSSAARNSGTNSGFQNENGG